MESRGHQQIRNEAKCDEEGGKVQSQAKLRCTCPPPRRWREGKADALQCALTSASSWGGNVACGCHDDHAALSFQEPWLLSRRRATCPKDLRIVCRRQFSLDALGGCAAGADRTCADRS